MAIWAGETIPHGKQPAGISDFFKIIFARAGGKNSINQEQKNSLGNHLGAWTFSYKKKYKDKILSLYMEHPFEDESGARWILNEFDGLYGININQKKLSYISEFTSMSSKYSFIPVSSLPLLMTSLFLLIIIGA